MEWTMFDKSVVLLAMTCGWLIAFGIYWLLTRKRAVYWNEKEDQIMTKDGKCLYDTRQFENLRGVWIDWKNECNGIIEANAALTKSLQAQISPLQSQIAKSKSGKDGRFNSLQSQVQKIEKSLTCIKDNTLLHQLQCSAKTGGKHKMVFDRAACVHIPRSPYLIDIGGGYAFKCKVCNLEITKTEAELTKTEAEGLKNLGLL